MYEVLQSSRSDNFSYVLYDEPGGEALLLDPVAREEVRSCLDRTNLTVRWVVNTHGHGDHTSGNRDFLRRSEAELVCHPEERSRISDVDRTVDHGDNLQVDGLSVDVLHTPGHTSGSICLMTGEALFSGDTVFLAGCGNPKFGGDTRELFESFRDVIVDLPESLTLCPGHDYANRNLSFALNLESNNQAAASKRDDVRSATGPVFSTLEEEKRYNPFFRFNDDRLAGALEMAEASPWERFREVRRRRNNW